MIPKAFEMLYGLAFMLIYCFLGGIAYCHRNCRAIIISKGKKNPVFPVRDPFRILFRDTFSLNNFEFLTYIHSLHHLLYVFIKLMILHIFFINHSIIQPV